MNGNNMWKLSIKDIKQGYAGLKKIARKLISYSQYEEALISIKHASILAQQFNWIYADDEIRRCGVSRGSVSAEAPLA